MCACVHLCSVDQKNRKRKVHSTLRKASWHSIVAASASRDIALPLRYRLVCSAQGGSRCKQQTCAGKDQSPWNDFKRSINDVPGAQGRDRSAGGDGDFSREKRWQKLNYLSLFFFFTRLRTHMPALWSAQCSSGRPHRLLCKIARGGTAETLRKCPIWIAQPRLQLGTVSDADSGPSRLGHANQCHPTCVGNRLLLCFHTGACMPSFAFAAGQREYKYSGTVLRQI